MLPRRTAKKLLLIVCLLILAGILVAGLYPLTPHLGNEVRWRDQQDGLHFGEYASILSAAPLPLEGFPTGDSSVELWIQPGLLDDSNTMLAFHSPESPLRFRIEQNGAAVVLDRQESGPERQENGQRIWIGDVLHQDELVLITVTASEQGTAVYLNGALKRSVPAAKFSLSRQDMTGDMVVGNSPVANDSWSGVLRGIATYNCALSPQQVQRNYESWTRVGRPSDLQETSAVAVYSFQQRSGKVIPSLVTPAPNLYIPDYYIVLDPPFLQPFWKHWGWNWPFFKDGLVNVFGFVPFGFFFCIYFAQSKSVGRAILVTIIFGCAVSFFIEATQFYLPTRDSDSMDFINNTLGTALGALCYRPPFVQSLMARFGLVTVQSSEPSSIPTRAVLEES